MSPDGQHVAVGDIADYRVRVFDRQSGEQIGPPLTYFTGIAWPVGFLDNERLLVAGSGEAIVWRYADTAPPLATRLCCHTGEASARFTPDGSEVVTSGSRDGQLLRWRAHDGRPLGALLDEPQPPRVSGPVGPRVWPSVTTPTSSQWVRRTAPWTFGTAPRAGWSRPYPPVRVAEQIRVDWSPTAARAGDHGAGSLGRALGRQQPAPPHCHCATAGGR